jgi:hypothetical protein
LQSLLVYGLNDIEILSREIFVAEGRGGEELWLLKRPFEVCQSASGTSPFKFFEGEAELQMCQVQTFTGRRTGAWNEPMLS